VAAAQQVQELFDEPLGGSALCFATAQQQQVASYVEADAERTLDALEIPSPLAAQFADEVNV